MCVCVCVCVCVRPARTVNMKSLTNRTSSFSTPATYWTHVTTRNDDVISPRDVVSDAKRWRHRFGCWRHRRRAVDPAGDLQELVHDGRRVLPVRRAILQDEVRVVDVQRTTSHSRLVRGLQAGRTIPVCLLTYILAYSGNIRLDESGFGFRECFRDARVYTCIRLQIYTIGASPLGIRIPSGISPQFRLYSSSFRFLNIQFSTNVTYSMSSHITMVQTVKSFVTSQKHGTVRVRRFFISRRGLVGYLRDLLVCGYLCRHDC